MKKKRAFTLLEIMIVIFLIGLIGSIIGYNMKGSLDEGKAFKTEQAAMKIQDLLELEIAQGADVEEMKKDPKKFLKASGIIKNADTLYKDGWGKEFVVTINSEGEVSVKSDALEVFKTKKKERRGYGEE